MKTLDVHALHEGIQHTIEKLDKQKQQLEKLEKSVEHFAGMKDALKGKGGDAIRTFYEECHKPFLLFFGMFIDEYKKVLKQTQHRISSVESDSHGMIAEAFLSHDARHGIKHAREVTEQLTDAVNRQTSAIDHIVSLPTVNDTFFRMETEQAERHITDTLQKLFQFDGQQTQALETAKTDFQTMKKYMAQLQTMYTGPKIEITGYKSGSILKSQEEENINQTFDAINPQMKQPDDSPMELMLKKLEKHKQSNVDTVMKDDKQQKIEREIYGDDSNLTVLQKEAAAHPKVYGDIRVINDKLYNHKGLKKIDTIEVIDELASDTASIDYVGGKYYVYETGQIVREFYAGGKKRLEEVSYIPEDKVGGADSLDSFLAGTQYEFIEWVSPQGAVKKLAIRDGKRVVKTVAKNEIKGDVKKVASKGASKNISHPVLDNTRSGSALKKPDGQHGFNDIIDNYTPYAKEFEIVGGDGIKRDLYQIEGGMKSYDFKDVYNKDLRIKERITTIKDQKGIFEWIVDPVKGVTHRRFIPNGQITGSPNQRP
ncbi:ribonuclease YxiD [Bacillus atrophaeus]|nr:T7SS effector LXG polymorphic toxin [Bacillus atrophaeus]MED4808187.1 T7SS effector LXG polymorphic toxin [Bacillus atrophaeus]GED01733.1 ribonuclease YxiD [Bacillus atrophaeus]